MKTRQWLIMLASCLALTAAPLVGCGDTDDPSSNNSSGNNNELDAGNNGNNNQPDGGQPDADEPDTDDPDGGEPDGGDADGGTVTLDCQLNDWWTGQVYVPEDDQGNPDRSNIDAHNGGTAVPADEVTLDDASLQAVVDAMPDTVDDFDTEDVNEGALTLETPIEVSGALLTATNRGDNPDTADVIEGNDHFWLQDANAEVIFFRGFADGEEPTEAVRVGDKVSFTVTEVTNYNGHPEITGVTGFEIDSRGNDVPFTDLSGEELSVEHYGQLVRVSGGISGIENPECGGSEERPKVCYEMSHGENLDKTVTLRSSSSFIEEGDCLTYFGPMGAYPAPLTPGDDVTPEPQLDSVNWSWVRGE